jgi:hypothetical protein
LFVFWRGTTSLALADAMLWFGCKTMFSVFFCLTSQSLYSEGILSWVVCTIARKTKQECKNTYFFVYRTLVVFVAFLRCKNSVKNNTKNGEKGKIGK